MRIENDFYTVLIVFLMGAVSFAQEKRFEPNDYGSTAKITPNEGLDIPLDYLDFLGLPKAWYYTTGNRNTIVGISDGLIDTSDVEFRGKTRVFQISPKANNHGMGVASIAAGQGNNAFAVPGVCYDCSIYGTRYGDFTQLKPLMEIARAGAKVINCSWSSSARFAQAQDSINKMFEWGTLIVASAGNKSWQETRGDKLFYPASYDKVIAVSSVMYKYREPLDNLKYEASGNPYVENILGFLPRTAGFIDHDMSNPLRPYHVSTSTLNEEVDILAPSVGVYRYSQFDTDQELKVEYNKATSSSAPLVTGTIGLLFSLNPCLPVEEVEPILKLTSMNIDHLEVNAPYRGKYGAGILQTGDAVELVFQLYTEKEVAVIDHQYFNRWEFPIRAFSKQLVFEDIQFVEKAKLEITARKQVILKPGTRLKPNRQGKTHIQIDSGMKRACDLVLRDPSILED